MEHTSGTPHRTVRPAGPGDVDAIVATLTSAFFADPLWGPAFPDATRRAAQAGALWRLFTSSAQRYPWTFVTDHAEAVALWLPPGGTELTDAEDAGYEAFLTATTDRETATGIIAIGDALEHAHPAEPHFYLSLLATHDDHRGAGLGMGLLRENLARIDALRAPAYLESSNPANIGRYASVGFVPRQEIGMPAGQIVTTMWREAAGPTAA